MHNATQGADAQSLQVLVAGRLFAPEEIAGPVAVVLEGATIRDIWREMDSGEIRRRVREIWPNAAVDVVELGEWSLAPGYIDLHTHGFCGHDVTTGLQEDVEEMARELPCTGVTGFFPTIATLRREETLEQVKCVTRAIENQRHMVAAEMLGIRLEGPFINREKKGAQYEPGIRPPDPAELEKLVEAAHGWARIIDYAPEQDEEGRFLATVVRLGLLPCIGHTSATYEQVMSAIDGGVRHSTHLFNAMSPLDHRSPGVPGAFLTDSRATIEIIADGIHMHPAITKLVLAARGFRDVALITDAVSPAGLPEGHYEFVGREVIVQDGAVRMLDGSLAGSILALDRAVRNIVAFSGIGWSEAIAMASQIPARIGGVDGCKGSIAPGMDADLIALDSEGYVRRTWVRGMLSYQGEAMGTGV